MINITTTMPTTDHPSRCEQRHANSPEHDRELVTFDVGSHNTVTLYRIGEDLLRLDIDGDAVLTAAQALKLAAALTEAARTLAVSA